MSLVRGPLVPNTNIVFFNIMTEKFVINSVTLRSLMYHITKQQTSTELNLTLVCFRVGINESVLKCQLQGWNQKK